MLWRTRDGRALKVVEMDDKHLANAIAFIENQWCYRMLPRMYLERGLRWLRRNHAKNSR